MPINGTSIMTMPPSQSAERPNSQPSALPPFGVNEIRKRTQAVQEIMRGVMKEGTHYGTIPGTTKPSLWKAGAEVLCMAFRLAPMLESRVIADDLDVEWSYCGTRRDGTMVSGTCTGFFEVESICTIQNATGDVLSRCGARCNNRETKYRCLPLYEIRNTILKMSEKRGFVSAVLMATGASDIFTQDIEDIPELIEGDVFPETAAQNVGNVSDAQSVLPSSPAGSISASKPGSKTCQGLTPKREAWLLRVAEESGISQDIMDRCLAFLRGSDSAVVKVFFDGLATKKDVFIPFRAEI